MCHVNYKLLLLLDQAEASLKALRFDQAKMVLDLVSNLQKSVTAVLHCFPIVAMV